MKDIIDPKNWIVYIFMIIVILTADFLIVNNSAGIEWSAAIGTILLAFFTYVSIRKNQENFLTGKKDTERAIEASEKLAQEMAKDRRVQFFRSQLDDFYSKVLLYEEQLDSGIELPNILELEQRKYLASKEFISMLELYKRDMKNVPNQANLTTWNRASDQFIQFWQTSQKLKIVAKKDYESIQKEMMDLIGITS